VHWLHFIGKTYWKSEAAFSRECKKYGVSRRVSLSTLKQMEFGDTVLTAMWDGKKTIVFGKFTLDRVYFTKPQTMALIDENLVETNIQHSLVSRGCGRYIAVSETNVDVPLQEVVKAAAATEDMLMIGGDFEKLSPRFILKNVPHRLGFRAFDIENATSTKLNAKGEPVLYGQFYRDPKLGRAMQVLAEGFTKKLVRITHYTQKRGNSEGDQNVDSVDLFDQTNVVSVPEDCVQQSDNLRGVPESELEGVGVYA